MNRDDHLIYWIAAAVAVSVLVWLWLTGALAGALFGGGVPKVGASELPVIAIKLLSAPGDPRAAWPRRAGATLPGPVAFYCCAVFVLGAIASLVLGGIRLAEHFGVAHDLGGSARRAPSARWASAHDLRSLRVTSPQPGRLTLGRFGRSLIAAGERQSAIVIAPTQSHKTTGLAIPALLEWEGPVLAASVKTDLLNDTFVHRQSKGEVMIFDPAHATELPRSRLTPLWGATTWRGAMRVAHWLAAAARTSSSGLQDADFWFQTAEKLLAPLLFAAANGGETMATVVRWLDEGAEASEGEVLGHLTDVGVKEAELAYLATQNREERQRSSVYTTAEIVVGGFADPHVQAETAAADFTPTSLLDGGANTLYLCGPLHEQERLRPIFSTVVEEVLAVVYETAAVTGKPLDPPLLLVLDEAANIAPIPTLAQVASTGAGQGVQLLSIFQDIAQIIARYGKESAATIVNNHRAQAYGAGISDPETLSWVARMIGAGEFEQRSRTAGEHGRASTTEGETYRDLVSGSVLREGKLSTAVLVYGRLPPARIRFRPWYREAALRKLGEASPAEMGGDGQ